MVINSGLENIGFKPIESQIYLYLLQKGPSSQQEISDNTQILRQTVYELVSKMELKGYISSSILKKRKVYSAIDPKILLNQLKEKEESFSRIIPELEKIKSIKTAIYSETFIGIDGLKNMFNLTLEASTDVRWLANEKTHNELFKEYYWLNYAEKRAEHKIPIKLLVNTDIKRHLWSTGKKELREVRKTLFVNNLYSSFVVFDDKVLLYSIGKDFHGVLIQDIELKKLFESIFDNLWKDAEKI